MKRAEKAREGQVGIFPAYLFAAEIAPSTLEFQKKERHIQG